MKRFIVSALGLFVLFVQPGNAQQKKSNQYKVACIGFYNVENLFDTVDDTTINDDEFLPTGAKLYTEAVYHDKLLHLADVISQLGKAETPDGLAVLGVAEVENLKVIQDLISQPKIKDRKYEIVHYDSPDARGIDVGLIYNPAYFKVLESAPLNVPLKNPDGSYYPTRDVLWVYGLFNGEPIHFFVNHWPSRRGGEQASAPSRALAASVARAKIDSIMKATPDAKIVLMGDLNDDPLSPSVVKVMNATYDIPKMKNEQLYNPWVGYYKKGLGTLAYQDAWNLFDQVIISKPFLNKNQDGFYFHKAVIFNKPYLVQKSGRYRGYPFRTYDYDIYMQGYSDHFPVYLVMLKKLN